MLKAGYYIESGNRLNDGYPTMHNHHETFQEAAESFEILNKRVGEHFRLRIIKVEVGLMRTNG